VTVTCPEGVTLTEKSWFEQSGGRAMDPSVSRSPVAGSNVASENVFSAPFLLAEHPAGRGVHESGEPGFIRTKAVGLRDVGFILLLDPHAVVSRLRHEKPDLVPERWSTAFVSRCSEIGVQLAPQADAATAT
jgi:hypothetical protein